MANKHQVLELLAKGLTPQQIAKKLGCSDAYVRATRLRTQDADYWRKFPQSIKRSRAKNLERYHQDPEFRRKVDARKLQWQRDNRERYNAYKREWYRQNRQKCLEGA